MRREPSRFVVESGVITGRMPITDEAGAITIRGRSRIVVVAMPWLKLAAFVCKLHKKHKAAKTQLEVFRMDRSGLVNCCQKAGLWFTFLAQQHGSTWP